MSEKNNVKTVKQSKDTQSKSNDKIISDKKLQQIGDTYCHCGCHGGACTCTLHKHAMWSRFRPLNTNSKK